jgi:hypothetical protein
MDKNEGLNSGLLYPQGWSEFFWLPEAQEYRDGFIALARVTQELSDEPWVKDGDELMRRWQHAVEHTAIYSLSPQERSYLSEVETVELGTTLVVSIVILSGEWKRPGVSFPVYPISERGEDEDEAIIVDLRDY